VARQCVGADGKDYQTTIDKLTDEKEKFKKEVEMLKMSCANQNTIIEQMGTEYANKVWLRSKLGDLKKKISEKDREVCWL